MSRSGSVSNKQPRLMDPQFQRNKDYAMARIVDLAKATAPRSVRKTFRAMAIPIACQAFTTLSQQAKLVCGLRSLGVSPSTTSAVTDVDEETTMYQDGLLMLEDGIILGCYDCDSQTYLVELAASNETTLTKLNASWEATIERANFYHGKCVHMRRDQLIFFKAPSMTFNDVVVPERIMHGFVANTIGFLGMKTEIKRRSVILHGPTGSGKTSLVKAAINCAHQMGVGTLMVTGDAFSGRFTPEDLIDFVTRFMSPCLVVFEDFDLIAADRDGPHSPIVGDLLAILDGADTRGDGIVIIGTTNKFEILDSAAIRPCRFDRLFKVDFPDEAARRIMWATMNGPGEIPDCLLERDNVLGAHIREVLKTHSLFPDRPIDEVAQEVLDSFFISQGPKGFAASNNRGIIGVAPTEQRAAKVDQPLIGPLRQ